MANYTESEVKQAVEKLVRPTVRRTTDAAGGARDPSTEFSDVQEVAAGCFLSNEDAGGYVAFISARNLSKKVSALLGSTQDLRDSVHDLERHVPPIDGLGPLAAAKVVITDLARAASKRSASAFVPTSKVARFTDSADGFLEELKPAVRSGGQIRSAPQEVRSRIPADIRSIQSAYQEILRLVGFLSSAQQDLERCDLARQVSTQVLTRGANVISSRLDALQSETPEGRLAQARETTLEILATKAAVQHLATVRQPGSERRVTGQAIGYWDTSRPAIPARLQLDGSGPYVITDANNEVRLSLDGGEESTSYLSTSVSAELIGVLSGPFVVTSVPDNRTLILDVNGDEHSIVLPEDTYTAVEASAYMDAILTPEGVRSEPVFHKIKWQGAVSVDAGTRTFTALVIPDSGLDLTTVLSTGDRAHVKSGSNNDEWLTVDDVSAHSFTTLEPVVDGAMDEVEVGAEADLGVKFRYIDAATAISNRKYLRLPTDGNPAAALFGFVPGIQVFSSPTAASAVASDLLNKFDGIEAEPTLVTYDDSTAHVAGRTDPTDARVVRLSDVEFYCDITDSDRLTVTSPVVGAVDDIVVGDIVAFRYPPNEGVVATVLARNGNIVDTAPVLTPTTGARSEAGGAAFDLCTVGASVSIENGVNKGMYTIEERISPFTYSLVGVLPSTRTAAGKYVALQSVSVGLTVLAITSKSRTGVSGLNMTVSSPLFNSTATVDAEAKTQWIQLSKPTTYVQEGDRLDYWPLSGGLESYTIDGVNGRLLHLSGELPMSISLDFDADSAPMARVQGAAHLSLTTFCGQLSDWQAGAPTESVYFREMSRLVNLALATKTTTPIRANDLRAHIQALETSLTALLDLLTGYSTRTVEPVDTLLKTLRDKGAGRAADLLLECQFTTFFELDHDGASYGGEVLKRVADLARSDLPVSKYGENRSRGKIRATAMGTDSDYSQSESTEISAPDIAGHLDQV